MGNYSQAQHEEALKANIISHARAVYGPKYPRGTVFDVVGTHRIVHGFSDLHYTSWVIVYPETKPHQAEEVVSSDWTPILESDEDRLLQATYLNLVKKLRAKMAGVMKKVDKSQMDK